MYTPGRVEGFADAQIYPPEQSASGTNAYYLSECSVVENRASYASCLKKIVDRGLGRLDARNAECSVAISNGTCLALKMKSEEAEKGQAIYFVSRAKLHEHQDAEAAAASARYASGAKYVGAKHTKFAMPATPVAKAPAIEIACDGGDYASAINAAMKESVPVVVAQQEPQKPMAGGMSLIEMARMKMSNKTN